MPRYPHLLLQDTTVAARYTATRAFPRERGNPDRVRETHAAHVIGAFEAAQTQREAFPAQVGNGFYESPGVILSFESDPNFPLAFESLDLGFLVDAQHDGVVGRAHVEADDVADLLDEGGIGRELEGLGAMRPQTECSPDA